MKTVQALCGQGEVKAYSSDGSTDVTVVRCDGSMGCVLESVAAVVFAGDYGMYEFGTLAEVDDFLELQGWRYLEVKPR